MSWKATAAVKEMEVSPPTRKLVLMCLADAHNAHHGLCCPSQERLAKEVGLSVRRMRDHLQALVDDGFIERVRRADQKGHRSTDEYRLLFLPDVETEIEETAENSEETLPDETSPREGSLPDVFDTPTGRLRPVDKEPKEGTERTPLTPQADQSDFEIEDWIADMRDQAGMGPARKPVADTLQVVAWRRDGIDLEKIARPTIIAVAKAKRDGPPSTLSYFDGPVREAEESGPPAATRVAKSGGGGGYAPDAARRAQRRDHAMETGCWYSIWDDPPADIQTLIDQGKIRVTEHVPSPTAQEA